ncbi:hypothetical protein [Streptomyces sp. YKOK-I1]
MSGTGGVGGHATATGEHTTVVSAHAAAVGGDARAIAGHTTAVSGHAAAAGEHAAAVGGHAAAVSGHAAAAGGPTTAMSEHAATVGGHTTAVGGHTAATGGHTTPVSEHAAATGGHTTPVGGHAAPVGGRAAAVGGDVVSVGRVDALLVAVPARDREIRPEALARAERQRRRWATQVVVVDELARRACAERGLAPPPQVSPARVLAVSGTDVADLGSIVAVALAHSPAARALLSALEAERTVPERAARDYYDRNQDRFLTADALRRGVDPYYVLQPSDVLPYDEVRDQVVRELRRALGRQAFFDWLDGARAGVEYAPGHEHPGDPGHPDHEHRH